MTVFFRSLVLLCLGFMALSWPADAARAKEAVATPAIMLRAGTHPDFDRLVVDWPNRVAYTVHRDGGHVTVEFASPAQVSWQDVVLAHVTRASGFMAVNKDGQLILSFNVKPAATVKDFTSGNSVVVDITDAAGMTAPPRPAAAKATAGHEGKTTAAPPLETAPIAPASSAPRAPPSVPPALEPPAAAPLSATPAESAAMTMSGTAGSAASPPGPTIPVATPASASPPLTTPYAAIPAAATAPAAPNALPSPLPAEPIPGSEAAKSSSPPSEQTAAIAPAPQPSAPVPAAETNRAAKTLGKLPESTDAPLLVATLDPHVDLRAVVYQRGGYGYIVFDRKLTLTLESMTSGQTAARASLEPIDLAKATGYRFTIPPNAELRAARSGTAWQLFITRQQPDVPVSASLVAQPDFALGARFLLPLPDAPEPVRLTDPVVGDDLILIALGQAQAFSVKREMADFEILPAAQGLVLRSLTDKLIVRDVTDGIEITAEGGLHLSTSIDTGASQELAQRAKAAAAGKSMFEFAQWAGKPGETFTQARQRIQQTIVDVPEAERNRARLELARFYFAHGNGEETSALLAYLVKLVPDLAAHADFRALDGAAKIVAWRPDDGLKDFATPALETQPEVELWQAVAQAELRNWKEAEEKFALTEAMLNGYPEPFYSRFSVLSIEAALAMGKDREAADWLDRLENGRHSELAEPAMEYLHGVLDAKAGHAQKAETAWKEVSVSNNSLYRVRAKMALIDLGVSTRSLTPAQAADQLE
ncbi:MAG: hypothetical protein M3N08_10445, partial [Pseudomonadota bacterium]|nr:hypothetical protein [Pseudomonadota bacterium]